MTLKFFMLFALSVLGLTQAFAASESVKSGGSNASSGSNSSGGKQCNISNQEKQCSTKNNFAETLAKTSYENAKDQRSGGYCLRGVRESFQEACGLKEAATWACQAAEDADDCFKRLGFNRNEGNAPLPSPPKPGTVFVYEGGEWGHIEVYTGTQKNGLATYCSDYCTNKRRDVQSSSTRKLASWWEPPGDNN